MDLHTLSIVAILLLICMIPYLLIRNTNKRRDKRSLAILSDFAKQINCNIDQYEMWNNTSIAIDTAKGVVLFIRKQLGNITFQHLELSDILRCKTVKMSTTTGVGSYSVIDKIELQFTGIDRREPDFSWEFYSMQEDGSALTDQFLLAEKWSAIINRQLISPT